MVWILLLLILGILFVLAEIWFVPGTTIVGIIGVLLMGAGIYMVYQNYGDNAGHITLMSSSLLCLGLVIYGLRSGVWNRYASKGVISGKMNVLDRNRLNEGDEGTTVSTIRPLGKARFGEDYYEVRSYGPMIPSGTKVRVDAIEGNKVFVKEVPKS